MGEGTWVTPGVEASAATFALVDRLAEYARTHGHSLLELAIAGARVAAGRRLGDRGRDEPAQVAGERGRRRVAADGRRAGGDPLSDAPMEARGTAVLTDPSTSALAANAHHL